MKTLKLSYAVCGADRYGKPCGKELRTPDDGLIFDGAVYSTGPLGADGETPNVPPLAGALPGVRGGGERFHARCWSCFLDAAKAPILRELSDACRASYDVR